MNFPIASENVVPCKGDDTLLRNCAVPTFGAVPRRVGLNKVSVLRPRWSVCQAQRSEIVASMIRTGTLNDQFGADNKIGRALGIRQAVGSSKDVDVEDY